MRGEESSNRSGSARDDERLKAVQDILRDHGFDEVRSEIVGGRGEIVALSAPQHLMMGLAEVAGELTTEIKGLGFHYIALDLDSSEVLD